MSSAPYRVFYFETSVEKWPEAKKELSAIGFFEAFLSKHDTNQVFGKVTLPKPQRLSYFSRCPNCRVTHEDYFDVSKIRHESTRFLESSMEDDIASCGYVKNTIESLNERVTTLEQLVRKLCEKSMIQSD